MWDKLTDLRKHYEWKEWLMFQKEVQNLFIKIIDSLEDDDRSTSFLSKEKTDEIVNKHSKGEVLFLVDIPGERKASLLELYYLPESRINEPQLSTDENVQMEDSVIWSSLSKNFLKSVGKIRVFCHPDIIDTCSICLKRPEIESSLESAYQFVIG